MIETTLTGLKTGSLTPQKQCEDGLCMANKLTKEECLIDWTKTNNQIHNLVRGICRCPSAYFMFNDKIIKLLNQNRLTALPPRELLQIILKKVLI